MVDLGVLCEDDGRRDAAEGWHRKAADAGDTDAAAPVRSVPGRIGIGDRET
jgi:hypothetical protein